MNQQELKALPVPVPPVKEQSRIIEVVDRLLVVISETELDIKKQLERAARLRQSILQRAFEGRL